jgi:hypothetical protein
MLCKSSYRVLLSDTLECQLNFLRSIMQPVKKARVQARMPGPRAQRDGPWRPTGVSYLSAL